MSVKIVGAGWGGAQFVKKLAKYPIENAEYHAVEQKLVDYYLSKAAFENIHKVPEYLRKTLFSTIENSDQVLIFLEQNHQAIKLAEFCAEILAEYSIKYLFIFINESPLLCHCQYQAVPKNTYYGKQPYIVLPKLSIEKYNTLICFIRDGVFSSGIGIDYADFMSVMLGANQIEIATAEVCFNSELPREEALLAKVIPQLEPSILKQAKAMIFLLSSDGSLLLKEIEWIMEKLICYFPDDATIIFATQNDFNRTPFLALSVLIST
ncbi:MAG: hypothetical protein Q4D86_09950 [Pasteurella oralis]|uniref:hypothetical protein n=1 Tax=Pasteurella oralis TaxID=1071947 RepID=UPI0026FBF517|nr:hypothetical protein [Pasteurella oralis]